MRDADVSDWTKRTYEFARNAPPPMEWENYEAIAVTDYYDLLNGIDTSEKQLQEFLEQNPSFVPGARGPTNSGHFPLLCSLFSQPQLTGVGRHIPDFMWVATDSMKWYPTLIEIEAPEKTVFKRTKDEPSADFSQARNQLAEWDTWFSDAANQRVFVESMQVPELFHRRRMSLQLFLIYGRRVEFSGNAGRERLRASFLSDGDALMSYDRLKPDRNYWNYITVRRCARGVNRCLAVPPTLKFGPATAGLFGAIEGVDDAIRSNALMSSERKEFLIERLAYWRDWAACKQLRVTGGDQGWE